MSEVIESADNSGKPAVKEKPLKSPCVYICVLNDEDICEGCYRTGEEITRWGSCNNEERRQVLARCRERSRKKNPFL